MEENNKKEIINIRLDDIIPNRFQPRLAFDENELTELSNSILKYGVIQPIVVRKVGEKFEIIAGERRYKASTLAGLQTIPAIIKNTDDNTSAEIALLENLQRKNLTVIEEAKSFRKLMDRGFTQEMISNKLGISQSAIANKVRLLNLPKEVQDALLYNKISERHARCLLSLSNRDAQIEVLDKIVNERLTVKQTEDEIANILNRPVQVMNISSIPRHDNSDLNIDRMAFLRSIDEELGIIKGEEYNNKKLDENTLSLINEIDDNSFSVKSVDIPEAKKVEDVPSHNTHMEFIRDVKFGKNASENEYNSRSNALVVDRKIAIDRTIDRIKTCVHNLNMENNTNIKTTENDLGDKYQIVIEINKNTF